MDAEGLGSSISTFNFVVSLVIWHNILFEIHITSEILQTENIDMKKALEELNKTKKYLEDRRNDVSFEEMVVDAMEIAEEMEIPRVFKEENQRIRSNKKQFTYESADEGSSRTPKLHFRTEFYYQVIHVDHALKSVNERFQQMT